MSQPQSAAKNQPKAPSSELVCDHCGSDDRVLDVATRHVEPLGEGMEIDVVVQRGTMHAWVNNGTQPCVFAFVLIDAKPAEAGGQSLLTHYPT